MNTTNTNVDVKALTTTLQQAIVPLFWGAVLGGALAIGAAVITPIAAAGGEWVAEKITGGNRGNKRGNSGYD